MTRNQCFIRLLTVLNCSTFAPSMRMVKNQLVIVVFCMLGLMSCKSEFEKTRESADPEQIYAKANEYYESEDYLKAGTLFELVLANYRGKKEGEELFYRYANTQFELGRFVTAAYYFERFGTTYANSPKKEEADFMVAHSYRQLSPSFRLEQTYTEKAITAYQKFVNFHPQSDRVQKCNSLIDEMRRKLERKAFDSAELYYKMANYKAALHSFENLLKDYPETPDAERIRYLIVKAGYNLADNSYYDKKKERFSSVLDTHAAFVKRYPTSEYKKELDILLQKSEQQLKKLDNV